VKPQTCKLSLSAAWWVLGFFFLNERFWTIRSIYSWLKRNTIPSRGRHSGPTLGYPTCHSPQPHPRDPTCQIFVSCKTASGRHKKVGAKQRGGKKIITRVPSPPIKPNPNPRPLSVFTFLPVRVLLFIRSPPRRAPPR
jgi:hypothetical protein